MFEGIYMRALLSTRSWQRVVLLQSGRGAWLKRRQHWEILLHNHFTYYTITQEHVVVQTYFHIRVTLLPGGAQLSPKSALGGERPGAQRGLPSDRGVLREFEGGGHDLIWGGGRSGGAAGGGGVGAGGVGGGRRGGLAGGPASRRRGSPGGSGCCGGGGTAARLLGGPPVPLPGGAGPGPARGLPHPGRRRRPAPFPHFPRRGSPAAPGCLLSRWASPGGPGPPLTLVVFLFLFSLPLLNTSSVRVCRSGRKRLTSLTLPVTLVLWLLAVCFAFALVALSLV